MDKSKSSFYTALSAILLTLTNGLFALGVTKLIIVNYGSDFNGLNSTASQFISMLLIIEGGFTIASNVALFKPISDNDYDAINGILSATRKIFNKIGFTFLIISSAASLIYALIIKSDMSYLISFLVFFMTTIATSFNLFYATKYRILLQSENKEYILNSIQITTVIISQLLILVIIFVRGHMLWVRFFMMLGAIINSLLIAGVTKKKYTNINYYKEPDYGSISGSRDIFVQKITSMIYSTIPVLFISGTAGTIYASVYIVYNNVFLLLKSIIYAFINSPRMGFGKLIAERDSDYVLKVFLQYEFIVNFVMFTLLSTAAVLIMPFISLYTIGITDANYYNWIIALFLICITFFEIIHLPSGNIINMAGKFKVGRKIQTLASIVLVIVMIIGNKIFGFYGILLSVLVTAILLAFLEIIYIHSRYFIGSVFNFLKLLLPNLAVIVPVILLEIKLLPQLHSYIEFFIAGIVIVALNSIILLLVNYFTNRVVMFDVITRLRATINSKI
ncbi:hypothetical protein [Proteiniclasticum ruminis]|uniref:Membrane protein involved in the export of O-antigen and teichoic acid n=1 Tax=Proteiniclasticum ruminis TaxID=398199 RepID=A0A1G8SB33_9CLOT|nr:hypothetical protein [Proteiniclasticum ruminis]SDJ26438.1 hypothetical protein SAMN05421804_11122 [Proteiniclasticum ruminis]